MASRLLALQKRKAGLKAKVKRLEAQSAAVNKELHKLDMQISDIDWDIIKINNEAVSPSTKGKRDGTRTRKLQPRNTKSQKR